MKKFGTPIGAAPGSDSEKVGLDALGTPLPDGRFEDGLCFLARLDPVVWVLVVVCCGCEDGRWRLVGRLVRGGDVDVLDVEVEVEVDLVPVEPGGLDPPPE